MKCHPKYWEIVEGCIYFHNKKYNACPCEGEKCSVYVTVDYIKLS